MWIIYALLGGVTKSFSNVLRKLILNGPTSALTLAMMIQVLSMAIYGLAFLISGQTWDVATLGLVAVPLVIAAVTHAIGLIANYAALKTGDLSHVIPFQALLPVLLLFSDFFVFKDAPGWLGIIGVLLAALGVYLLNTDQTRTSPLEPFKAIFTNRASQLSLLTVTFWTVGITADRMALEHLSALAYAPLLAGLVSLSMLPLAIIRPTSFRKTMGNHWMILLLAAGFGAAAYFLQLLSLTGPYASFALALRRVDALTAIWLGHWILKEKQALRRFRGAILLFVATILIVLS